jgi:Protein of unknown function (DUF3141)
VSDRIIAALDTWGDLRDRSLEQVFPAIYGTPGLQALAGYAPRMRARDGNLESKPSESHSSESGSVRSKRGLPKAGCGRR